MPESEAISSYQSDSWDDDGTHFQYTFDSYTELCGFSKARLYMSCNDMDDMDVYVIIRKLDREGTPLLHMNIPLKDLPSRSEKDLRNGNIYKHIGPNGRIRASKRLTAPDPRLNAEKQAIQDPTEVWYPHTESQKVPIGEVIELEISIWPGGIAFNKGESLRFEVKGHEPILPEPGTVPFKEVVTLPEQAGLLYRVPVNQNIGKHFVHTGEKFPSSLTLPLIFD